MSKTPKRPRDPNELAHSIMRIATGEAKNDRPAEKDPAAVAMGKKGGAARAKNLTAEERKTIAENAAKERWHND